MHYIPNSDKKDEMLREIGLSNIDELFSDIPDDAGIDGLKLPLGESEITMRRNMARILSKNKSADGMISFIGAGIYNHHIPAAVKAVMCRSEFYTAYTPYQPEISQGMLQALFEYQSLIAELTGMDVVNASMYDGATAFAEAVLLAVRHTGKKEVIVPKAINRDKLSVLHNYTKKYGIKIKELAYDKKTGKIDIGQLKGAVNAETACAYIENPNFFGVFEDGIVDAKAALGGALLIAGVNPLTLSLVSSPGDYGADIAVGDGQVLGNPMALGGPSFGIFACREELARKMPGRVIGMTKDARGGRAFCMTLQTREQHIRRDKATSNICSNEALCAVAAAAYIAVLGRDGLAEVAGANMISAQKLSDALCELDGVSAPLFDANYFNEFVIGLPADATAVNKALLTHNIQGGLPLAKDFPELGHAMLITATEKHTEDDLRKFADALVKSIGAAGALEKSIGTAGAHAKTGGAK